MPNKEYTLAMARYNLWQNESALTAAGSLCAAEREKDRGAFFGSIQQTFSHIYWGDMLWLSRFAGTCPPEGGIADSIALIEDWEVFCGARKIFDQRILQWAHEVSPDWFRGDLNWFSGAMGHEITKPKKTLVIQLFNHQTHHRGQIHAMLTSAGAKPDDTDVPFMPEIYLHL